jgi:hypothetical protein
MANRKVAMVKPVPVKPNQVKPKVSLVSEILRLGGGRPYILVEDKPGYWLVQFLGDSKPTKISK